MGSQSTTSGFILCLKDGEDKPISLYKSLEGVLHLLCADLKDEDAFVILDDYTRVLSLFRYRGDIFSGLYIHNEKSKNVNLHLRKVLRGKH